MKIAICDDEPSFLELFCPILLSAFQSQGLFPEVEQFIDSKDLFDRYPPGTLDILFIDRFMPGEDGLKLSKRIQKLHQNIRVVLITSDRDSAVDGYAANIFRFIPKDNIRPHLAETVSSLADQMKNRPRPVSFIENGLPVSFPLEDVIYIESLHHDMVYHLISGKTHTTTDTLDHLEKKYQTYGFFRIQKSFIINLKEIQEYSSGRVMMSDKTSLSVSRSRTKLLRREYIKLFGDV